MKFSRIGLSQIKRKQIWIQFAIIMKNTRQMLTKKNVKQTTSMKSLSTIVAMNIFLLQRNGIQKIIQEKGILEASVASSWQ